MKLIITKGERQNQYYYLHPTGRAINIVRLGLVTPVEIHYPVYTLVMVREECPEIAQIVLICVSNIECICYYTCT